MSWQAERAPNSVSEGCAYLDSIGETRIPNGRIFRTLRAGSLQKTDSFSVDLLEGQLLLIKGAYCSGYVDRKNIQNLSGYYVSNGKDYTLKLPLKYIHKFIGNSPNPEYFVDLVPARGGTRKYKKNRRRRLSRRKI